LASTNTSQTSFLNENPGDYRCVITGGGEILKELHFTIGENALDGHLIHR